MSVFVSVYLPVLVCVLVTVARLQHQVHTCKNKLTLFRMITTLQLDSLSHFVCDCNSSTAVSTLQWHTSAFFKVRPYTYTIRTLFLTYGIRLRYFAVRWPHYMTTINYIVIVCHGVRPWLCVSYRQPKYKSQHWMCHWFSLTQTI